MPWNTDEFTGRRFGKYEVLCRLAVGGMAEIFLGFARAGPFMGRPVVLKRILNEQREDPNALQMLLDEAKMTATLSHPNVAQVFDLETADDEVLLVIEFITGANLEELVEAFNHRQELAPLGFVFAVVREAAQGLGHAHANVAKGKPVPIIHRDVTPRNIMVDFSGATKVLDFGIARAKGSERRTQAGMVRGTTSYMSPEQAIGKDLDPRTDLFSLGIILHELLTGQRLFYKGNPGQEMAAVYEGEIPLPSKVHRRVPRALDAVVMRALERNLDKRFQTAEDFSRELSMAAVTASWGRDRCAELVRERFAKRQDDIARLVALIPNRRPSSNALAEVDNGAATLIAGGGPLTGRRPESAAATLDGDGLTDPNRPVADLRRNMATVVPAPTSVSRSGAKPKPEAAPLVTPEPEPHSDSENPVDPDSQVRVSSGVNPATDFSDEPTQQRSVVERNPRLGTGEESPTNPSREAIRPPSGAPSRLPLVVAALGALVLGGLGGAFIVQRMVRTQPSAMVRFTIATDRPAVIWLGEQELGAAPLSVIIPAGDHHLVLQEPEGTRRAFDVSLPPSPPEARKTVALDSLPKLP